MATIKIKYHDKNMPKIEFINGSKSDWIDLRASREYHLKQGEFALIDLGVSMKLPEGYEAHLAPRSSTFKHYGVLQTNSVGVVDESYCGENDVWKMPVYATRDTTIGEYDRICQFRIISKMQYTKLEEVESMDAESRGGFGSSGVK